MTPALQLDQVTLCAAASVNVAATIAAMQRCLAAAGFAQALLFTDQPVSLPPGITPVTIRPLRSSRDYSRFVLKDMAERVSTSHCLIVQWDGFILDPGAWDPAFLDFDYIGAPWPQFDDGHDVGNGGFSLRSLRLMRACQNPRFVDRGVAEDIVIARDNRAWLEEDLGLRFADRATASRFSFERDHEASRTFGFHGVFNLPEAVGIEEFWDIYQALDDIGTVRTDFRALLAQVAHGPDGWRRALRMLCDRVLPR